MEGELLLAHRPERRRTCKQPQELLADVGGAGAIAVLQEPAPLVLAHAQGDRKRVYSTSPTNGNWRLGASQPVSNTRRATVRYSLLSDRALKAQAAVREMYRNLLPERVELLDWCRQ